MSLPIEITRLQSLCDRPNCKNEKHNSFARFFCFLVSFPTGNRTESMPFEFSGKKLPFTGKTTSKSSPQGVHTDWIASASHSPLGAFRGFFPLPVQGAILPSFTASINCCFSLNCPFSASTTHSFSLLAEDAAAVVDVERRRKEVTLNPSKTGSP